MWRPSWKACQSARRERGWSVDVDSSRFEAVLAQQNTGQIIGDRSETGDSQRFAPEIFDPIYFGLNEKEKAIDAYRKGTEIDPNDAAAHFNLGELYYDLEELVQAEKECMEAIRLDPSFTLAYLTMGNLCLDQERLADAVKFFEQYLKREKSPRAEEMIAEVKAVVEGLKEEMKG